MKAVNVMMYSVLAAGAAAAGWMAFTSGVLLSPITAAAEYIGGAAQGFTSLIPSPEAITAYISQNPALIITGVFSVGAAGYGLIQKVISGRKESAAAVKLQEMQTQNLDVSAFATEMASTNKVLTKQVETLKAAAPDVSRYITRAEQAEKALATAKQQVADYGHALQMGVSPTDAVMIARLEADGKYKVHKIVA